MFKVTTNFEGLSMMLEREWLSAILNPQMQSGQNSHQELHL